MLKSEVYDVGFLQDDSRYTKDFNLLSFFIYFVTKKIPSSRDGTFFERQFFFAKYKKN